MNNSPASEAIAMLIDLAQKGEIDPWDVQVIEIIDRFLAELGIKDGDNFDYFNTDLSHSGQVMLWASMLVLLKADTLERLEQQEEENEDILLESSARIQRPPLNLEEQIKRRTSAPPPRKRRVTLAELITQLQEIEQELKQNNNLHQLNIKKTKKYTKKEAQKTVTELAHDENLTGLAEELNKFLVNNNHVLSPENEALNFDDLINIWSQYQETEKKDRVGIFWALLLLASQSKVELSQEEFYQDLSIISL